MLFKDDPNRWLSPIESQTHEANETPLPSQLRLPTRSTS